MARFVSFNNYPFSPNNNTIIIFIPASCFICLPNHSSKMCSSSANQGLQYSFQWYINAIPSGTDGAASNGAASNGAASNGTADKASNGTAGAASSGTAGIASSCTAEEASSGTEEETCSWMSSVSEGITKNMEDVYYIIIIEFNK